jgi:formate/nitrite transporter FocA (FNT family)
MAAVSDAVAEPHAAQLDDREQSVVEDRLAPRAAILFETIRIEGAEELERPAAALAFSGFAAGLSMGFTLVAIALLRVAVPADAPWRGLFENLGYPVGFLIVILGRQQLFTENTVTAILPLLDSANRLQTLGKVARLWGIVLATNLAGAALFAYAVVRTPVFAEPVRTAFLEIGRDASGGTFATILLRGIFAGWLIALLVWVLPGAPDSRFPVITIISYVVGAAGLSHIIAGSIEVMTTVAAGERTWSEYATGFLVPVFIGNAVGGIGLVSLLNYGQVATERPQPESVPVPGNSGKTRKTARRR